MRAPGAVPPYGEFTEAALALDRRRAACAARRNARALYALVLSSFVIGLGTGLLAAGVTL